MHYGSKDAPVQAQHFYIIFVMFILQLEKVAGQKPKNRPLLLSVYKQRSRVFFLKSNFSRTRRPIYPQMVPNERGSSGDYDKIVRRIYGPR
jgi:hypothetical protein